MLTENGSQALVNCGMLSNKTISSMLLCRQLKVNPGVLYLQYFLAMETVSAMTLQLLKQE